MEPETAPTQLSRRIPSREVQSAEAQIASVDEQIAEHQGNIDDAELQIEVMQDEIGKRQKFIRAETRRQSRLIERRAVFIDAASALRKLERP